MNIPLTKTEFTPEDLLTLPDGPRYELVDGRLVERHLGANSSRAGMRLGALLDTYVTAQKLGYVFGSDCGFQCFPNRPRLARLPDVSFVARGRLPNEEIPDGHVQIPPELAVEAVSPNDLADEVDDKIEGYLGVGVPLVWVIYPRTRSVMVFRADGSVSRLKGGDELSGEKVVPGFSCRVADLFPSPA